MSSKNGRSVNNSERNMLLVFSLIYLVIPCIIFSLFFIKNSIAVILLPVLLYPFVELVRERSETYKLKKHNILFIFIFIFSFIFASIFGVGYFGFQTGDHDKNEMIFKELINNDWPVVFNDFQVSNQILSYPLGFFLAPALIGKVFGWEVGNISLYLNHAIGIFLVFLWIIKIINRRGAVVFFIFFGGWDIAGELLFNRFDFVFGTHIEWWTTHTFLQYSSFTTVLAWSAQHFASQFLGVCIIYYLIHKKKYNYIIFTGSIIAFWSHFTLLGYASFIPLLLRERERIKLMFFSVNNFVIIFLIVVFLYYTSKDGQLIPHGFLWNSWDAKDFAARFFSFYVFEFLLLSIFLFINRKELNENDSILLMSCIVLLSVLPLYRAGWSNDFSMRGSGPALFILYLISMKQLFSLYQKRKHSALVLVLILLIGWFSGLSELYRQFKLSFAPYSFYVLNVTEGEYVRGFNGDKTCLLIRRVDNLKPNLLHALNLQGETYSVKSINDGTNNSNVSICTNHAMRIIFPKIDAERMAVSLFDNSMNEIHGPISLVTIREIGDVNSISSRWPEQYTGSGTSVFSKYLMKN